MKFVLELLSVSSEIALLIIGLLLFICGFIYKFSIPDGKPRLTIREDGPNIWLTLLGVAFLLCGTFTCYENKGKEKAPATCRQLPSLASMSPYHPYDPHYYDTHLYKKMVEDIHVVDSVWRMAALAEAMQQVRLSVFRQYRECCTLLPQDIQDAGLQIEDFCKIESDSILATNGDCVYQIRLFCLKFPHDIIAKKRKPILVLDSEIQMDENSSPIDFDKYKSEFPEARYELGRLQTYNIASLAQEIFQRRNTLENAVITCYGTTSNKRVKDSGIRYYGQAKWQALGQALVYGEAAGQGRKIEDKIEDNDQLSFVRAYNGIAKLKENLTKLDTSGQFITTLKFRYAGKGSRQNRRSIYFEIQ
ncbi:MAG: hypothetical protein AAFV25_20225 [Bacteroidota bacterium]